LQGFAKKKNLKRGTNSLSQNLCNGIRVLTYESIVPFFPPMVKEKHRSKNILQKKTQKKLKNRRYGPLPALGRFYNGIAVFLSD
jgi:hypothetical protein